MTTSQMRDEERQQLCRDGFPQQVKRDDSDPEIVSVSPIFHVRAVDFADRTVL